MTMPEGKQCATCKRQSSGCADVDFAGMKVLRKQGDIVIIKLANG